MFQKYVHLLLMPVMLMIVLMSCSSVQAQAQAPEETGGICILKTDAVGNPLGGARYQVAREATVQEANDSALDKMLLKMNDEYITVVYVPFVARSQSCTEAELDIDGKLFLSGLPYGTYYLVETKPPDGYERMQDPIRIRIHKYSHLTAADGFRDDNGLVLDNTVHIITLGKLLPETGETEGVMVVAAFVAAVFSGLSAVLLLLRKVL